MIHYYQRVQLILIQFIMEFTNEETVVMQYRTRQKPYNQFSNHCSRGVADCGLLGHQHWMGASIICGRHPGYTLMSIIHTLHEKWTTKSDEKLLIFRDNSSAACQETFSAGAHSALKLEVAIHDSPMKYRKLNCMKYGLKFVADAGYLCKVSMTSFMFRCIIKNMSCAIH